MSEQIKVFGKWVLESRTVAGTLYCINAIAMVAGAAFLAMKPEEWNAMSAMNRVGWSLLLVGNVTNTLKAYLSNSSKKDSQ